GPVALIGAGEFLPGMVALDRDLLAASGRSRPRVAILPTASAPDGEAVFRRWADMGCHHFAALGAEVEPVLVQTVADGFDAASLQAIGEADLIYLSGGKPGYLRDVLAGSPLGAAIRAAHGRGAAIAGCSAGAMVMAELQLDFRRRRLPWPARWSPAQGLVAGVAVLPHYDGWPEALMAMMALQAPRGVAVLGLDEGTAAVDFGDGWRVVGAGRVTVWRGRHRQRYRSGEAFSL
ncbi:MAG: Type 1 glutamine amidotransferase-like domain-containing protein, partial [Chloroflexota bacterium]